MPLPIPNCYRLPHGQVYGGEYPGALEPTNARRKIAALLDAGITIFLDLTAPADRMLPYDAILAEEAAARGIDARRVSIPVRDMGIASPDTMHRILDEIDARMAEGRSVYVHCWGGVGRTGTVIGCHLVRRGSAGDAALDAVREHFGTMTPKKVQAHGGVSPQTAEQRDMVRRWRGYEAARRGKPR